MGFKETDQSSKIIVFPGTPEARALDTITGSLVMSDGRDESSNTHLGTAISRATRSFGPARAAELVLFATEIADETFKITGGPIDPAPKLQ